MGRRDRAALRVHSFLASNTVFRARNLTFRFKNLTRHSGLWMLLGTARSFLSRQRKSPIEPLHSLQSKIGLSNGLGETRALIMRLAITHERSFKLRLEHARVGRRAIRIRSLSLALLEAVLSYSLPNIRKPERSGRARLGQFTTTYKFFAVNLPLTYMSFLRMLFRFHLTIKFRLVVCANESFTNKNFVQQLQVRPN